VIREFLAGIGLFGISAYSLACSCIFEERGLEEAVQDSLHQASSVVLAQAVHVKQNNTPIPTDASIGPDFDWGGDITQFNEIQSWKGEHGKSFHTKINTMCCMCGYSFEAGKEYLLYLYGPNDDGYYSTSICSRTKPKDHAEEEIQVLNRIAPNKPVHSPSDAAAGSDNNS
jgi:hypothetical protein